MSGVQSVEADSHQTQVAQTRLLGAETPPQVTSTSSMLSVSTLKLSAKPSYLHHLGRLPLASSLHEVQPGQGFSLLLCVDSPVLLAGTAVFLPYRSP